MRFHYITAFKRASNSYIFSIFHVILFSVNHSYCRISHILVYQKIFMGTAITGATTLFESSTHATLNALPMVNRNSWYIELPTNGMLTSYPRYIKPPFHATSDPLIMVC